MPKVQKYTKTTDGLSCCPHCNFTGKVSTVSMHVRAKHSGAFKYKCEGCNYEASTQQILNNHIAAKHPDMLEQKPKDLQCPDQSCNYSCRTKGQLRSHYLLKHCTDIVKTNMSLTEESEIQCTCCGEAHASKPAYLYHLPKCVPADTWNTVDKVGLALS